MSSVADTASSSNSSRVLVGHDLIGARGGLLWSGVVGFGVCLLFRGAHLLPRRVCIRKNRALIRKDMLMRGVPDHLNNNECRGSMLVQQRRVDAGRRGWLEVVRGRGARGQRMTRYVGIALPAIHVCAATRAMGSVGEGGVCHVCVYRTEQNRTPCARVSGDVH